MLHSMEMENDASSPEAIAKIEGIAAFLDNRGIDDCPYLYRTRYHAHWLAGWLEAFSGERVMVQLGSDARLRG